MKMMIYVGMLFAALISRLQSIILNSKTQFLKQSFFGSTEI
jgi:hypothetical protein